MTQIDSSVFNDVRNACRAVADNARHVRIASEAVPHLVARLCATEPELPALDTTSHHVGTPPETAAFFLTLAAVNFGSGYFPHLRKRPGRSGYYTIATALKERFERSGPIPAGDLAAMTAADCATTFGQDRSDPDIAELMERFSVAWNDLGRDMLARADGDVTRYLAAANGRAHRLVRLLAGQPFFHDVQDYHGLSVPFFKRAQLLASDLSLALDGEGLGRFDDLGQLTIFADNLVPHVLRLEGVLLYTPDLLDAIESGHLLPAGSDEEIEIRACSVHAVECVIDAARAEGLEWTARDVDQLLWHRGQTGDYKSRGKRHRTKTVFY